MILIVTLNPALDVTHHVAGADWSGVNRPHAVTVRPGGKGVNVAATLHALGMPTRLAGLAGGPAGDALRAGLRAAGLDADLTGIAAETRRTFAVVDTQHARTALFNEPGPPVTPAEYAWFRDGYRASLSGATVVVLSGSLPPDLPENTYAELIRLAADAGVPAILDTDGPPLLAGAAAGPALVKPNLAELERCAGRSLRTAPSSAQPAAPPHTSAPYAGAPDAGAPDAGATSSYPDLSAITTAAQDLRATGAQAIVVSLGPDGLLAVTGTGNWRAVPPGPAAGNPTGAGDAAVAGLALGLATAQSWPDRLRQAVALGTAAVAAPVAGEFSLDSYRGLLADVRVHPADTTDQHARPDQHARTDQQANDTDRRDTEQRATDQRPTDQRPTDQGSPAGQDS